MIDNALPIAPSAYSSKIQSAYAIAGKYDIDQFNIDTNPVETLLISPSDITKNTGRGWKPWNNRRQLVGKVMGGSWYSDDPEAPQAAQPYPKLFTELPEYKSFKQHFVDGVAWENTPLYDRWMAVAHSDDNTTYENPADVIARFEQMDKLFSDIKKYGYKSQLALSTKTSYLDSILNEVNIDIGPEGQPLFVDGRHRLCIAKLLDIDQIPVCILVRHRRWVTMVENYSGEEKSLLQRLQTV